MKIVQKTIILEAKPKGFHLITEEIEQKLPEIKDFKAATVNLFLQHTSASLTINENFDSSVRRDLENYFNDIVPENLNFFTHIYEGSDDMPSHIKSVMIGVSLTVPIQEGKLALGTWQGIYLNEHRYAGGRRKLLATIIGE